MVACKFPVDDRVHFGKSTPKQMNFTPGEPDAVLNFSKGQAEVAKSGFD
jgi:hypothetical protein